MLAVAAIVTAAQNFVIVRGTVVNKGSAFIDTDGHRESTRTVTLVIENADRVYRIRAGTAVEYAISDTDAKVVQIGSHIELLISLHNSRARVLAFSEEPRP